METTFAFLWALGCGLALIVLRPLLAQVSGLWGGLLGLGCKVSAFIIVWIAIYVLSSLLRVSCPNLGTFFKKIHFWVYMVVLCENPHSLTVAALRSLFSLQLAWLTLWLVGVAIFVEVYWMQRSRNEDCPVWRLSPFFWRPSHAALWHVVRWIAQIELVLTLAKWARPFALASISWTWPTYLSWLSWIATIAQQFTTNGDQVATFMAVLLPAVVIAEMLCLAWVTAKAVCTKYWTDYWSVPAENSTTQTKVSQSPTDSAPATAS